MDNPLKDDDESNALYNILDWDESPLQAAIVSCVVVFLSFPLFTTFLWGLSLVGRRYVEKEQPPSYDFDEEIQYASPY